MKTYIPCSICDFEKTLLDEKVGVISIAMILCQNYNLYDEYQNN